MKTFDPTKIYQMTGTDAEYVFAGYYFTTKKYGVNNVIIGHNTNTPIGFVHESHVNTSFCRDFVRDMHEVVKMKYQVAFKNAHGNWVVSTYLYESLEAFYAAGNSGVQKNAVLLVEGN